MKASRLLTTTLLGAVCAGATLSAADNVQIPTAETAQQPLPDTMSAAALLPDDADSVVVLNNEAWMKLHRALGGTDRDAEWESIKSIAFGMPNSTTTCIDAVVDAAAPFAGAISSAIVLPLWALVADEQVRNLQMPEDADLSDNIKEDEDCEELLHALPLFKFYTVLEFYPGKEATRSDLIAKLEEKMQNEKRYEQDGWKGFCLFTPELTTAEQKGEPIPEKIRQAAKEIHIYLLYKEIGNHLILACCNNPEQLDAGIDAAKGPQCLSAPFFNEATSPLNTPMLAARIEAPALNSLQRLIKVTIQALEAPIRTTFAAVAVSDFHAAAEMKKSLDALDTLGTELAKLERPVQHPLQVAIWHTHVQTPPMLRMEAEWDACGAEFTEGTLRHCADRGTPVFTMQASGLSIPNAPNLKLMAEAGIHIINGIFFTVSSKPEDGTQATPFIGEKANHVINAFSDFTATWGDTWRLCIEEFCHQGCKESENGPVSIFEDRTTFNMSIRDSAAFVATGKTLFNTIEEALESIDENAPPAELTEHTQQVEERIGNVTFYHDNENTGTIALTENELIFCTCRPYAKALTAQESPHTIRGFTLQMDLDKLTNTAEEKANISPLLNFTNGGAIHVTTENGKMKLYVELYTTGLK